MTQPPITQVLVLTIVLFALPVQSRAQATRPVDYAAQAHEVMADLQERFYLPESGLYAHSVNDRSADFMWGNGIMFSALVGAARHEPKTYLPIMSRFFTSLDGYWDAKCAVPGYEPAPTRGNGNDKYYDDNAWMVLTFIEAHELTGEAKYKRRALESLNSVLSGWDDAQGGGIWWHVAHKDDAKNTCVNAPAAVGCLNVAHYQAPADAKASRELARRIVDWTVKTLEADDGLFYDNIKVSTGTINTAKLTYNTALMIRAYIALYRATEDAAWLKKAVRAGKAADWFLGKETGAYRDELKWSHLMVEADLELYRLTQDEHYLARAGQNAAYQYSRWKAERPKDLIESASIARTLWLLADTQSDNGRVFWKQLDDRK